MEDSIPFGEGGEPWNKNTFSDFQNLQYQILDQGECVSTCLSSRSGLGLSTDPNLPDPSALQLTYNDTTGVLASYFTNMATIIKQEVY